MMSLVPGQLNMTITQGGTFRQPLILYEGVVPTVTVTTVSGLTPLNLNGYTGLCVLRTAPHQDPPLYQMTTAGGGIIISPTISGSLQLYMPATDTIGFSWKSAVYDFFLTDVNGNYVPAGDTIPFLTGQFSVKGNSP